MPELSPEQRLVGIFQEHGVGAIDAPDPNAEEVIAEAQPPGPESALDSGDTREQDSGPADPDVEDPKEASPDASATEDEDEGEASQSEGIEAATLAQILGIEENVVQVDENGQPAFSVTVDGGTEAVPLSGLLKGYQQESAFTQKSQQLAEDRQQFEQQKQQELQTFTLKGQAVDQVLKEHQDEVLAQYNRVDWDDLERNDPGRFAAERTKYAEIYQKLDRRRSEVQNEVVRAHQAAEQEFFQRRQSAAVEEGRKLRAAVPEWDTDEKASQGALALDKFLRESYGFTQEDLANTINHRAYLVALDALRWRTQQTAAPEVKKRLAAVPRVLKPGVPTSAGERQRVNTVRAVKRHHQVKSVDSAAEALLAKGIV